jgi:GNAT superfamily N-acetyltransferase
MASLAAGDGEILETGSLGSTPAGDNLLLDYARADAGCFAAIAGAAGGRVEHRGDLGLQLAETGGPSPFNNTAHLTSPVGEDATPALADALREFFGRASGGQYLLFSPWPTGDLSRHGFQLVGHPPLMVRPPSVPAAPSVEDPNLRLELVETAAALADFEQTIVEAYPVPELQPWRRASFLHPSLLDSQWRLFAGYEDDRCVATAGAWSTDTVTVVEIVSVRDECRGKGYGAAITAAATHAVTGQTAMLIASDIGRPVYDRLGYLPLLRYTLYLGTRS